MRFSTLMFAVSLIAFAKANEGSGGNSKTVETDNVNGEKIKLTQADLDNIKAIIEEGQTLAARDGADPMFKTKDDVLGFAQLQVWAGIAPTISESLAMGHATFDSQIKALGITDVGDHLDNHERSDEIATFDDVEYDGDADPDAFLADLQAMYDDMDGASDRSTV